MNATHRKIVVVESSPGIVDRILTSFSQTSLASDLVIAPDVNSVRARLSQLNPRLLLIRSTQIVDLPWSIPVVAYVTEAENYAALMPVASFDRILLTEDMIDLVPELIPVWCAAWELKNRSRTEQTITSRDSSTGVAMARSRLERLSPREQQVIELIAAGKTNRQVATVLQLSPRTIQKHRARIVNKLNVRSVAELVRLVLFAHGNSITPE